jgi:hypothetical protein
MTILAYFVTISVLRISSAMSYGFTLAGILGQKRNGKYLPDKKFGLPHTKEADQNDRMKNVRILAAASTDSTFEGTKAPENDESVLGAFYEVREHGNNQLYGVLSTGGKNRKAFIHNTPMINNSLKLSFTVPLNMIRTTFLPIGYPNSVPPEYLTYQKYNTLQDFCSYLRGIMSTQAILEGMGVGRSDVTALQVYRIINIESLNYIRTLLIRPLFNGSLKMGLHY